MTRPKHPRSARRTRVGGHRTPIAWTPERVATLGTMPDRAVAAHLGISLSAVSRERSNRKIAAFPRRKMLPRAVIDLLGKESDRSLAERFRRPYTAIADERNRRGIPPAVPPKGGLRIRWTRDMDRLLGQFPAHVLAKRWRCGVATIHRRRQVRRVPPPMHAAHIRWTSDMLGRLGRDLDQSLAQQWGVSANSVSLKRKALGIPRCYPTRHFLWTPERIALLGRHADAILADRWGISRRAVAKQRRSLGIKALVPRKIVLSLAQQRLLGQRTDRALARAWGISEGTLMLIRHELGIPRCKRTTARRRSAD